MFQSALDHLRERQTVEPEGVEAEAGFTLIELMVVLLIIAILLAIAIPTFLGVTSSANDRAAQSNLTNGLTEATAQYQSSGQSFSGISTLLASSAPEYTWVASAGCGPGSPNCISVAPYDVATPNDEQGLVLAAMSKAGTCWYVAQLQATPTLITSGETSPNVAFNPVALGSPTTVAGNELNAAGTALLTTAGTYYAKKAKATPTTCNATYPSATTGTDSSTGFKWGSSFSSPGSD